MAGLIQRLSSTLYRASPVMGSMLPKVISFAASRNITTSYCGNPELLSLSSTKFSKIISRFYTTPAGSKVTMDQLKERVLKVCSSYDKVAADKLSLDAHFLNDLGLDSLDHVEVIMAMEDEFGFEIPDGDAEKLIRPKDIVRYIADKEDIYE